MAWKDAADNLKGWVTNYPDMISPGVAHPNPAHNAHLVKLYASESLWSTGFRVGGYGLLGAGAIGAVGYGAHLAGRTGQSLSGMGATRDTGFAGAVAAGTLALGAGLAFGPTRSLMFKAAKAAGAGLAGGLSGLAGMRGTGGLLGGVTGIGVGAYQIGKGFLSSAEKVARVALTGPNARGASMLDAWLPFYKTAGKNDFIKFAPNPTIMKRLGVFAVAGGIAQTAHDVVMGPLKAPPPSIYHDGRTLRHMNDMGANAEYGQRMLGYNSSLNNAELMSAITRSI